MEMTTVTANHGEITKLTKNMKPTCRLISELFPILYKPIFIASHWVLCGHRNFLRTTWNGFKTHRINRNKCRNPITIPGITMETALS